MQPSASKVTSLALLAAVSSGTFAVTATRPELTHTGNICAHASDPRCAAFLGDIAAFTTGAVLWAHARETGDGQYATGGTLMLGVLLGNALAAVVWPGRM